MRWRAQGHGLKSQWQLMRIAQIDPLPSACHVEFTPRRSRRGFPLSLSQRGQRFPAQVIPGVVSGSPGGSVIQVWLTVSLASDAERIFYPGAECAAKKCDFILASHSKKHSVFGAFRRLFWGGFWGILVCSFSSNSAVCLNCEYVHKIGVTPLLKNSFLMHTENIHQSRSMEHRLFLGCLCWRCRERSLFSAIPKRTNQ